MDFATDRPVRAQIYLDDGHTSRLVAETGFNSNQFSLPVLGLRPDTTYKLRFDIRDAFSMQIPFPTELAFRTDPLPADFPSIAATVSNPELMEPGVTLFNLTQLAISMMVAVNERGEVIWFYRHSLPGLTDIKRLSNGHLVFTDSQGAAEIDMLGNLYRRWSSANIDRNASAFATPLYIDNLHHEIYETTRGTFLTLATEVREFSDYPTSERDADAPTAHANVVGDVIIDFANDGSILQRWSFSTPGSISNRLRLPYRHLESNIFVDSGWHTRLVSCECRDRGPVGRFDHRVSATSGRDKLRSIGKQVV